MPYRVIFIYEGERQYLYTDSWETAVRAARVLAVGYGQDNVEVWIGEGSKMNWAGQL